MGSDPIREGVRAGLEQGFGPDGPFAKAMDGAFAPVRAEIGRLRKVERHFRWKPMESAPKDGRSILVSSKGDLCWACWVEDETGAYWDRDIEYGGSPIEPDSWFPVPAPPAQPPPPTPRHTQDLED